MILSRNIILDRCSYNKVLELQFPLKTFYLDSNKLFSSVIKIYNYFFHKYFKIFANISPKKQIAIF